MNKVILHIIRIVILMKFLRTVILDDFCHFTIPHSRRGLPSSRGSSQHVHSTTAQFSESIKSQSSYVRGKRLYYGIFQRPSHAGVRRKMVRGILIEITIRRSRSRRVRGVRVYIVSFASRREARGRSSSSRDYLCFSLLVARSR